MACYPQFKMTQIAASDLALLLPILQEMAHSFSESDGTISSEEALGTVQHLVDMCKRLGWVDLGEQSSRLVAMIERADLGEAVIDAVDNLYSGFRSTINRSVVFVPNAVNYELLNNAVRVLCPYPVDSLSQSAQELNMAGRCLAFGLPTASVSHAMRCVESSLRYLNTIKNRDVSSSMTELADINVAIGILHADVRMPSTEALNVGDDKRQGQFETIHRSAAPFKVAWKHYYTHKCETYSDDEARQVVSQVGSYLSEVARWVAANTPPTQSSDKDEELPFSPIP